ncbi:MAG: hypothetical protein KAT71_03165 [Gammaproteobacteria bacterium]|nr:hypothetical protein [Gammaproteobacteria bacterium]
MPRSTQKTSAEEIAQQVEAALIKPFFGDYPPELTAIIAGARTILTSRQLLPQSYENKVTVQKIKDGSAANKLGNNIYYKDKFALITTTEAVTQINPIKVSGMTELLEKAKETGAVCVSYRLNAITEDTSKTTGIFGRILIQFALLNKYPDQLLLLFDKDLEYNAKKMQTAIAQETHFLPSTQEVIAKALGQIFALLPHSALLPHTGKLYCASNQIPVAQAGNQLTLDPFINPKTFVTGLQKEHRAFGITRLVTPASIQAEIEAAATAEGMPPLKPLPATPLQMGDGPAAASPAATTSRRALPTSPQGRPLPKPGVAPKAAVATPTSNGSGTTSSGGMLAELKAIQTGQQGAQKPPAAARRFPHSSGVYTGTRWGDPAKTAAASASAASAGRRPASGTVDTRPLARPGSVGVRTAHLSGVFFPQPPPAGAATSAHQAPLSAPALIRAGRERAAQNMQQILQKIVALLQQPATPPALRTEHLQPIQDLLQGSLTKAAEQETAEELAFRTEALKSTTLSRLGELARSILNLPEADRPAALKQEVESGIAIIRQEIVPELEKDAQAAAAQPGGKFQTP